MLASLRKVTYPNFETIVDNGSPTTTPTVLKKTTQKFILISENLGFAGVITLR
jgi:GT2 family glycosyltransferase